MGFPKLPPPSREAELTSKWWVGLQLLKNLNALSRFRTGLWGVGCTRSSDCPLRVWDTSWTEPPLERWNGNKPLPFLGPQKIGIRTSLGRKSMLVLKRVNFNFCLSLRL